MNFTGTLIHRRTGKPVVVGERVTTFRGEFYYIKDIIVPHKPESTGRVVVSRKKEGGAYETYFPGVIDATWIGRTDQ